jgi:hypothetical protein
MGEDLMDSITTSAIVYTCISGSVVCGMYLRYVLPNEHMSTDSRDAIKLSLGVMASIASVALGMLVASAKGFYDMQTAEVVELSDQAILLDRTLAHFGPEAMDTRDNLRASMVQALDRTWRAGGSRLDPGPLSNRLYDMILQLPARDDGKRGLKTQALTISMAVAHQHWLMHEQMLTPVPPTLLIILASWLSIIFLGFGLLSPRNATVTTSLFISALTVSGAFLLILEMYRPYQGLIQVPSAPVREAIAQIGR